MTPAAWQHFYNTEACEHCSKPFKSPKHKCRDHDHITGEFRAVLCSACNSKATLPTSLTICTHNSINYDNHFYILGIARLQNGPESHKGIHEFAGFEKKDEPSIKDWKLDTLANSTEKLKCISFGPARMQIRFIDTCSFLRGSLEKLIEMQSKMYPTKNTRGEIIGYDYTSAFPNVTTHHRCTKGIEEATMVQDILKSALRKIPFPYNGMTGPEVWSKSAVLEREHYYDDFAKKHISDQDYESVQALVAKLGMTTFRDYHDQYFEMDYLALCDIFEAFRSKYHANLGVDPAHYLGIPGAALDALLKNSGAHIENICKESCGKHGIDLMNDVNENIRGGMSCMFTPYAKANNPLCSEYHPDKPHTWIIDLDVNSLYPHSMTMPLPVGGYRRETRFDNMSQEAKLQALHNLLDTYKPDNDRGYMLVVGFHVPQELHDEIDFAPCVSRAVSWDELSKRQRLIKELKALSVMATARSVSKHMTGSKKLVPDLGHRIQGIHIEHAQELYKLGICFTIVERVWSFKQALIFKGFIEKRAKERGESADETYREIVKILMNSLFGKMLENKKGHTNRKLYTDLHKFLKAAGGPTNKQAAVQDFERYEDGSVRFLGIVKHNKKGGIVLDTPRMIGWAILEYSKLAMLRLHYTAMRPHFGKENLKLLMTDTDSLYYLIARQEDPIDEMKRLNDSGECNIFDLSRVPRYKSCPNKNKLGCVKYEAGDEIIEEAVFLASKMYAKKQRLPDGSSKVAVKGKGIPSRQLKRLYNFEAYKEALFHNKSEKAGFFAFRSSNHIVKHCEVVRQGLSADNDKVFILGPEASRPLGHFRNIMGSDASPMPDWEIDEDLISEEQQGVLRAARLIVSGGLAGPAEDPTTILLETDTTEDHEPQDDCTECGNETDVGAFDDDELFEQLDEYE